ncbi:hypothetical protein LMG24235_05533 [Paraburkholderia sabiae]|nr:hypothetical protein LMG24235_05533 [Paraburkholderia sabiae]CAG9220831.1 conserved hypothetical protein [Paraburkholderia sabiae]
MQCCTLTHSVHTQPDLRRTLYVFMTAIAARLGWYRLERLLNSIPDSNDDFMIF